MNEKIKSILSTIPVPGAGTDIIAAGLVKNVTEDENKIEILLAFEASRGEQLALEAQVKTQLAREAYSAENIKIKFETKGEAGPVEPQVPPPPTPQKIRSIKKIIAVGSGKGGVGKSTASINLAASLAAKGYKVGLLDADMYGPSIGQMAGFDGKTDLPVTETKITPGEKYGMKIISFSMLIDRAQAVVWRGPMLGKALEQLIFDIDWGRLDYLIIDLPPGTGDIQLSMAQLVEVDGFIIVTTPQNVALHDAERAADMLKKVNIPLVGVIENMSEFICPSCGHATHIFSKKGGETIANELNVKMLGSIPINPVIMESGEKGIPVTAKAEMPWDKKDVESITSAFDTIIDNLQKELKKNANT